MIDKHVPLRQYRHVPIKQYIGTCLSVCLSTVFVCTVIDRHVPIRQYIGTRLSVYCLCLHCDRQTRTYQTVHRCLSVCLSTVCACTVIDTYLSDSAQVPVFLSTICVCTVIDSQCPVHVGHRFPRQHGCTDRQSLEAEESHPVGTTYRRDGRRNRLPRPVGGKTSMNHWQETDCLLVFFCVFHGVK